jgi:uncharacterized protein YvpB
MRTTISISSTVLFLGFLLSACNFPSPKIDHTPSPTQPSESSPPATDVDIQLRETNPPEPSISTTDHVLLTPTDTQPNTTTPYPANIYFNEKYQFSFQIPAGWSLEEIYWEEMEGPTQAVELTKDHYRIVLHFKTVFEEVFIGPRGLGGTDVEVVKLDEISVFEKDINGYRHVYQGNTKRVLFSVSSNELRLFAGLSHETGPDLDFTWENIVIPPEIQLEFINLMKTLTRTGTVAIPESVALLAEIPLILPLEKVYYSQIYDTDVANACGPAAALMVLDYYGQEDSMEVVIQKLRTLPSPGAFDPGCYINTICTSPEALTMLLYDYGLHVRSHENWTLPEIFSVVSKGHPLIVDILWDPETASLGHFVVVYGVDLKEELIYYHDPYRGRELSAHWDDFASLWEGRVDIGDPLKPEGHQFWGLEIQQQAQNP